MQVLDLGLRLMHLLGSACRSGALGAWVASLVGDVGASRPGSGASGEADFEVAAAGCRGSPEVESGRGLSSCLLRPMWARHIAALLQLARALPLASGALQVGLCCSTWGA